MYNILIVDDDTLFKNTLSMLLSELSPKYQICAAKNNGAEALDYIRTSSVYPLIVITDIKMPVMDGLEFLSILSKEFPKVPAIVLSNYDEFEYVRSALKYGITDYWLKHELNLPLVRSALDQAISRIPEKQEKSDLSSEAELKEIFIINLLTGTPMSDEKLRLSEKIFSFPVHAYTLIPIIMQVNNLNTNIQKSTLSDTTVFNFIIKNIISELADSLCVCCIPAKLSFCKYCILFSFSPGCGIQERQKKISDTLNLVSVNIRKFLNTKCVFTSGDVCRDYKELPASFRKAEYNADNQFVNRSKQPLCSVSIQKHAGQGLPYDIETILGASLKNVDKKSVFSSLDMIFDYMSRENLDRQSCQMIFSDLYKILTLTCKVNHALYEEISPSHIQLEQIFSSVYDYETIRQRFYDSFLEVVEYLSGLQDISHSGYVQAALSIIQNKYNEDISLNSVAEEIGISGSYLSTLFKSETSMNFSQYVNQFRIKKTLTLLKETSLSTREIAKKCGYYNYDYFFKAFKKVTGMTPSAYLHKNSNKCVRINASTSENL